MPRGNNLPALQCSFGPQSIPRPDTTGSKTLQVELQRTPQPTSANQKRATYRRNQKPLPQNNQECTNRNTTDAMEGPETASMRHLHVTSNISDAAQCIRANCLSAKLFGCDNATVDDELAKANELLGTLALPVTAIRRRLGP